MVTTPRGEQNSAYLRPRQQYQGSGLAPPSATRGPGLRRRRRRRLLRAITCESAAWISDGGSPCLPRQLPPSLAGARSSAGGAGEPVRRGQPPHTRAAPAACSGGAWRQGSSRAGRSFPSSLGHHALTTPPALPGRHHNRLFSKFLPTSPHALNVVRSCIRSPTSCDCTHLAGSPGADMLRLMR
jgi:hypothetical protein